MSAHAEEAVPAGKLYTVITHLAMESPPEQAPPPPPAPGITLQRRWSMPVADYLRLYHAIGDDWLWWSRLTWDESKLAANLTSNETEVYVAEADSEEIGLIELNLRPKPDIELRYFGLIPSWVGKGLGGWLLAHALAAAGRHRPRRMILNTCTLDHPAALAFYQRRGFAITHSEVDIVDDPRLIGLLPRDAAPQIPLACPAEG